VGVVCVNDGEHFCPLDLVANGTVVVGEGFVTREPLAAGDFTTELFACGVLAGLNGV